MKKHIIFSILFLTILNYVFGQHQSNDSTSSSANEYMHQNTHEDLAKMFESSDRDAWQKPDEVIKYLGEIENKTVVDVGSGSGYFSFRLVHAGANVVAADVDADFLKMIEEKRIKSNISEDKLKILKISEINLNIDANSADIVFLVNVYHHISDRINYFSSVNSTLSDLGKIVIVDFFKKTMSIGPSKSHKISIDVVVNELKKAGYTTIEIDTDLLEYQYIITAYKF